MIVTEAVDSYLAGLRPEPDPVLAEMEMAFVDGVKAQCIDYFDLVLPLLGPGAVLAVDNVLVAVRR